MKLTIITVCYNSEKTISQTFDSILNQKYKNIEYIIIDGKSTDQTLQIIKKYENRFKEKNIDYRYISEKDNGIYDAMNKGINLSTGDVIGIINSDDWYEKNIFSKVMKEFEVDLEIDILYGKTNIVSNEGKILRIYSPGKLEKIVKTMVIPHPTVFVRRCIYNKFKFNINNKIASDYEFLLENYLSNSKFKEINEIITNFRFGGESSTQEILGYKEVLKIQEKKKIKGIIQYISYYKKIFIYYIKKINFVKNKKF